MTSPSVPQHVASDPAGTGRGTAIAHHGELLQGIFEASDGSLVQAIVSLPCPIMRSTAVFSPNGGQETEVRPSWRTKALRATRTALEWLGESRGGTLAVESEIPVERGLGSSTADVVSAIRAVAQSFSTTVPPEEMARLAVLAEGASDGVMFGDRAVLYANRVGYVLEDLGGSLPQLEVLGFDAGGSGVDTLRVGLHYSPWEVGEFRALRGLLRHAIAVRSPAKLAEIAAASARINQRHLPNRALGLIQKVQANVAALGYQVAHSGKVIGLIFDPADPSLDERVTAAEEWLAAAGVERTWRFRSPGDLGGHP